MLDILTFVLLSCTCILGTIAGLRAGVDWQSRW